MCLDVVAYFTLCYNKIPDRMLLIFIYLFLTKLFTVWSTFFTLGEEGREEKGERREGDFVK